MLICRCPLPKFCCHKRWRHSLSLKQSSHNRHSRFFLSLTNQNQRKTIHNESIIAFVANPSDLRLIWCIKVSILTTCHATKGGNNHMHQFYIWYYHWVCTFDSSAKWWHTCVYHTWTFGTFSSRTKCIQYTCYRTGLRTSRCCDDTFSMHQEQRFPTPIPLEILEMVPMQYWNIVTI